jgi:hypothetical protein
MDVMVSISFMIYLAALLLAPLIAAFYAGLGAALRMAVAEVVIVIAAWLLIAPTLALWGEDQLGTLFVENSGSPFIYIMAAATTGAMYLLLLIPLQTVLAGLAAAALGCVARAALQRLRR